MADDLDYDDDLDTDTTDDDAADSDGFVRMKRDDVRKLRGIERKYRKLEKATRADRAKKALDAAGLSRLTPAQAAAVARLVEDPTDAEQLRAQAEELFGPAPDANDVDAEVAAHGEAEAAVTGAAPANSGVLKPEDVNGWPPERLMRLNQDHPTVFEALMRGETVPAPTAA